MSYISTFRKRWRDIIPVVATFILIWECLKLATSLIIVYIYTPWTLSNGLGTMQPFLLEQARADPLGFGYHIVIALMVLYVLTAFLAMKATDMIFLHLAPQHRYTQEVLLQ